MGAVDRGVLATANELFESRHFPGVVALVDVALEAEPEDVPLLLLRARAHFALRRDLEAQSDLRDVIRLDPQCGRAYRLLGELAARRDEYKSAAIFFREALRLDPDDTDASDWLAIVDIAYRPAAAASKSPALAAAAGRLPLGRTGRAISFRPPSEPEPPATAVARGSTPNGADWIPASNPFAGRRATISGASSGSRPMARSSIPELPGFGDYLVSSGILTRERLRAAQAYQRSMKVQLSTAIVTLGLATPQRIEWAAVAHQSQVGRPR